MIGGTGAEDGAGTLGTLATGRISSPEPAWRRTVRPDRRKT
jgi:hypothetical protein